MKEIQIPEISFPTEPEGLAIKYAAFDIMRQLRDEGRITDAELAYLADKYDITVEK